LQEPQVLETVLISPVGKAWAVKHNGGFLGYTQTRDEAALIARDLVEWISAQGRDAELVVEEDRSFRQAVTS
jgi:hypothetical protein